MIHPVVDRFWITPPLDPAMFMVLVAIFLGTVTITRRRPAWGAALLLAVPPFTWDHTIGGTTISIPKVVLLGTIAGIFANRRGVQSLKEVRLVILAFAAMLLAIAVSAVGAEYRVEVLREWFKWIEYALFFSSAYACIASDTESRPSQRAYTVAIAIVCASAISEYVTGGHSGIWLRNVAIPRIAGVLDGPNQLAGYLETAVAFLAVFASRTRPWVSLVLTFAIAVLILTFSRSALIGFAAIMIAVVAMRGTKMKNVLVPLLGGVAIGIASLAALIRMGSGTIADIAERSSDTTGAGAGGVGTRSELWRAALYFIRHHPLTGVGAGNFERRLPEAGLYGIRTHANSWPLQAFAEGGIVLFAASALFVVTLIVPLWKNARNSPWALAALAATIALVVHQFADYLVFYPKVAEPWLVLCAFGCARSQPYA